jgi:hypothetical protein
MKKTAAILSVIVILIAGLYGAANLVRLPATYDGRGLDLTALHENPENYEITDPDGAAEIIVKENLAKTRSENVVASVVFNFRGYDTMGESFVLLTAIVGSLVILRKRKKED